MKRRIIFPGAVFHVIQRGVGNEAIFLEDNDRLYFLKLLTEICKNFDILCYSYCLMDNHLHLLLKDNSAKLSEFMKILLQRYAQYFNLKYKRIGHLFARRFEAKLCLEDSYLLILSRYIHLNPLKAGVVKEPVEYIWSSYNYYIKNTKLPSFLNVDFILKILSEKLDVARELYKKFIFDGIKNKEGFKYPDNIYNIVGDLEKLLALKLNLPSWIEKLAFLSSSPTPEKIKECKEIKDREGKKFLFRMLHQKGFSIKEIATLLNYHYSTVSRHICK